MTDYIKQANDFCEKYGIEIEWGFIETSFNPEWGDTYKDKRNKWRFAIYKDGKRYTGIFWDSIINSVKGNFEPSNYDLLACLTKYDPCTFKDFCCDFGYDEFDENAKKTYRAVIKEYKGLCRVFGDDSDLWEEFREIV